MRRLFACLPLLLAVGLSPVAAAASDAKTTRIEPRPFYGATVTLEAGVRVFRPLPPTKHIIINPNRTPLNLSETNIRSESTSHNYYYDQRSGGHYDGGYGYYRPAYGLPLAKRGRGFGRFKGQRRFGRGGRRGGLGGGVPVRIGR